MTEWAKGGPYRYASMCMAVSCKIHHSRSANCIIKYSDHYRKRSEARLKIVHPIRAQIFRIYFPGMKSQECGGITDFENYCIYHDVILQLRVKN